jgi:hypothetical protein
MIQRMVLGLIGGALIVLSVFLNGNTLAFSGAPTSGASWAILGGGAIAALFSLFGVRTLMAFGAGAAAAIVAADVVDAARAGTFQVTTPLVVLTVGVLATLAATIGRRSKRVVVADAVVAPDAVAPVVVNPVVVAPVVVAPDKVATGKVATGKVATDKVAVKTIKEKPSTHTIPTRGGSSGEVLLPADDKAASDRIA